MAQPLREDLETVERVLGLIGGTVTLGVQPTEKYLSGQLWTVHLHEKGGYGMGQGGTFAGALADLHAIAAPKLRDAA